MEEFPVFTIDEEFQKILVEQRKKLRTMRRKLEEKEKQGSLNNLDIMILEKIKEIQSLYERGEV